MPGASFAFETGEEVNREKNGSSFVLSPCGPGFILVGILIFSDNVVEA